MATFLGAVGLFAIAGFLSCDATTKVTKVKPDPVIDTRILVTAVDVAKGQITLTYQQEKKAQVYGVDDFTKVTVSGVAATIKQIKVGQQVRSYTERDFSSLDDIDVGIADPAPVQPKK